MPEAMFIVCGEALFDVFMTPSAAGGPPQLTAVAGGSPFNVAIGLARMGVSTAFLGGISVDPLGQTLVDRLVAEGISDACLVRCPERTTLSLISTARDGSPAYCFYGEGAADISLGLSDLPDLPAGTSGLHIGSYTMVVGATAASLLALVKREHRRFISCDVNVRLNVEPDPAVWRARVAELLPLVTVLKFSEEDAALLWPGRDRLSLLTQLAASGPPLVVLTRGAGGAMLHTCRHQISVPAPVIEVLDTVGAGDAFTAQLLAMLAETGRLDRLAVTGISEADLLLLGQRSVAAASLTCQRRGADPPDQQAMHALGWPQADHARTGHNAGSGMASGTLPGRTANNQVNREQG